MVRVEFTNEAKAVLRRYKALPARMGAALARAMNDQNQITLGEIVERRLSFPRTIPPTLEGLRVINNTLRASMSAQPAEVRGNEVRSSIGSAVKYAAIHEFGGVVQRREHQRRGPARYALEDGSTVSRLSARRQGLVTKSGRPTKRSKARLVAGGMVRVRAHAATYPARAFVRRTLEERREEYGKALSAAVIAAARKD